MCTRQAGSRPLTRLPCCVPHLGAQNPLRAAGRCPRPASHCCVRPSMACSCHLPSRPPALAVPVVARSCRITRLRFDRLERWPQWHGPPHRLPKRHCKQRLLVAALRLPCLPLYVLQPCNWQQARPRRFSCHYDLRPHFRYAGSTYCCFFRMVCIALKPDDGIAIDD